MIDPEEIILETQFAFEDRRSVRKLWFQKLMTYIYKTFFLDPDFQDTTYPYKEDTFLLLAICFATSLILAVFSVKLSTYFYYKRSIQNQIKVVNNRLKSMHVSVDIVKKIIAIHECIVRNQQEIEQLRHKKSIELSVDEYDAMDQKDTFSRDHVLEPESSIASTDTGLIPDKEHISDSYIEPISRKSKTRYTVLSAKSRSQPNFQSLHNNCETKLHVKRSASDTELSSGSCSSIEHEDDIHKQLVEVDDTSNHTDLTDFIKYVRNSSVSEDIKSCSHQIVEFLNDFEASIHDTNFYMIPMEKHVEIKVLFEILVGQINDQIREISNDLLKI